MKYIKTLKIDIDKKNFEVIPSVQYDSNTRFLHIQLLNESTPFNITGCSVVLSGTKEDGNPIFNSCDIINSEIGFIQAEVTEQMNAIPGYIDCEIKIYDGEGVLTSKKFTIKVTASQTSREVESTGEFKALTEALNKANSINNKIDRGEKIPVSQLDKNNGKLDQTYFTDEFLQQMAGNTPVNATPSDKGITSEKYADKSIQANAIGELALDSIGLVGRFVEENIENLVGDYNSYMNEIQMNFSGSGQSNISNDGTYPLSPIECPRVSKINYKAFSSGGIGYIGYRHKNISDEFTYSYQFWVNVEELKASRDTTSSKEFKLEIMHSINGPSSNASMDNLIIEFKLDELYVGNMKDKSKSGFSIKSGISAIYGEWMCFVSQMTHNNQSVVSHTHYIRSSPTKYEENTVVRALGLVAKVGTMEGLNPYKGYSLGIKFENKGTVGNPITTKNAFFDEGEYSNLVPSGGEYLITKNNETDVLSVDKLPSLLEFGFQFPKTANSNNNSYIYFSSNLKSKADRVIDKINGGIWLNKLDISKLPDEIKLQIGCLNKTSLLIPIRDIVYGKSFSTFGYDGIIGIDGQKSLACVVARVEHETQDYIHVEYTMILAKANGAIIQSHTHQPFIGFTGVKNSEIQKYSVRMFNPAAILNIPYNPFEVYGADAFELYNSKKLTPNIRAMAVDTTNLHEAKYHRNPNMPPQYYNAIRGNYGELGPISSNTVLKDNATLTYVFDENMYKKYGLNNVIRSELPVNLSPTNRWSPVTTFIARIDDLNKIGIVPNDDNPPVISLRGAFKKADMIGHDPNQLQIWFALRYGDTAGSENAYETTLDATFINGNANPSHLANGDNTTFKHNARKIETEDYFGWIREGVPVRATYKGKPLQHIAIRYIGYRHLGEGIPFIDSSFDCCFTALTSGSEIQDNELYLNIPSDVIFEEESQNNDGQGGIVTIQNSDKVVMIGDSYTACHYTLPGKAYIHNLSQYSDYNFENFARSGDDYGEMYERLSKRTPEYHGSISIDKYGGTFAVLLSNDNDGYLKSKSMDYYYDNLRKLVGGVQSLGMYPIVCTEFSNNTTDHREVKGLKAMADELGAGFIDIATKTKIMNPKWYLPFWGNGHPATRTTHLFSDEIHKALTALPRPRQSLKIFRKRSNIVVNDISNLLYYGVFDKSEIFKEIACGHCALKSDQYKYFDDLDVSNGNTKQISEYLKIQNNESVSLNEYTLVECILPVTSNELKSLTLNIAADTPITVYCRSFVDNPIADYYTKTPDLSDSWYEQYGKPQGEWIEISGNENNNKFTITNAALIKKCLNYDKVTFIIKANNSYNISDINVEYEGGREKIIESIKPFKKIESLNAELLAKTHLDSLEGWTITGNMEPFIPTDGIVPISTTKCVEVSPANKIKQTVEFGSNIEVAREAQIKIWCRVYPEKFNYQNDFNTSPITLDSYDYATLITRVGNVNGGIKNGSNTVWLKDIVGLHWKEVVFNITVPTYVSNQEIEIYSKDKNIQIARVSVKML